MKPLGFVSLHFMIKILMISALMLGVFSCMAPSSDNKRLDNTGEFQVFFRNLTGKWLMDDQPVIEQWQMDGEIFRSAVFNIGGADTLLTEEIRVFESDTGIFYEARVTGQNEGKPVLFKLVKINGKTIVFGNPEHDFPQQIIYEILSTDKIRATIQGMENQKKKSIHFNYTRMK